MYIQEQLKSVISDERTQHTPVKQIVDNRALNSVQTKLKQIICQQKNYSKHIPLHKNPDKTLIHKGGAIQCLMSKYESAEKDQVFIRDANELGYKNVAKTEYADMLIKDSKAYVQGNSTYKRIDGVKRLLDTAELKNGTIKDELINSVAREERVSELNKALKDEYEKYLCEEYSLPEEQSDIIENYTDTHTMRKCMDDYFGKTLEGFQVGDINIDSLPETWSSDIARAFYLQTYHNFIDTTSPQVPYIQPYLKLINDINAGNITKLSYSRKYKIEDGGFGAEFEVEEPAIIKNQYENEAVVHTHYIDKTTQPNFAHTKPYIRRYASGYGHTMVNLPRILAIDDTKKVYSSL